MTSAPAILSTATAVPDHSASQEEVKARLRAVSAFPGRRLDAALELFDHAAVERRYSAEPLADLGVPRTVGETQDRYRVHAVALGQRVAAEALARAHVLAAEVDLIITVSCTGIMIPSFETYFTDALGFRRDVRRMPITSLGCCAGAAALARAHDFLVGFPEARVLVISVELPSLSLQRTDSTLANMVASALFGDGAAAVVLTGRGDRGVRILDTLSHLFPHSTDALGFDLRDDGFHSVLSKEVPALIRSEFGRLVKTLAGKHGLSREDLSCFVLHPGGRKILAFVEEEMGLDREQTAPSWDVLRDYGNQSSASVLFVLHEWLTHRRPPGGSHGILAAFGPGLTAELLLLEWS